MSHVLGIDLGGTRIKYLASTPNGEVLVKKAVDFDPSQSLDWRNRIQDIANKLPGQYDIPSFERIGISAPGLAAQDARSIRHMPGRLKGLEGLDWTDALGTKLPVQVMNDAQAALMGEVWKGAAQGLSNVLMITLGTGVGGAAMVDGQLLRGHIGRAGHLGHISLDVDGPPDICRTPGSLETAIGNCSIKERTKGRFTSTHDLVKAGLQGDTEALHIWHRSVRHLAAGLVSLINVLDPEAILLGGGIAESGRALLDPLQRELDRMEWIIQEHRVAIISASLGEFAGAYGAACMASADV